MDSALKHSRHQCMQCLHPCILQIGTARNHAYPAGLQYGTEEYKQQVYKLHRQVGYFSQW